MNSEHKGIKSNNAARFILPVLLILLVVAACQDNRAARNRAGKQQIVQELGKDQQKQLEQIRQGDAIGKKQDTPKQGSALDAAAKELAGREPVDPRAKEPVEPTEVHPALVPMIQDHWVRLHPGYEVWLDNQEKQVVVGGRVSLRDGRLEMFACPAGTKEHESVISTVSNAETIHIGLLGVGAIKGIPAYWTEDTGVVTATGPVCKISVGWQHQGQQHLVSAKELVLNERSGKQLECDWVFAGSRVWTDPDDPEYREYQADGGDLICVSNFPSAMLDLNIESSTQDAGLLFVANPEKIPILGQPVLIFIKPDLNTNPNPQAIVAAEKKRDEAQAKMQADMEARMKAREAEYERLEQEARAERQRDEKDQPEQTGQGDKNDGKETESNPDKR